MFSLLALLACSADHQVIWDDVASDDIAGDVAVSILTLGTAVEGDRELLDGLQAAGTSLEIELHARDERSVANWTVRSLDADLCQVVAEGDGDEALRVTLLFRKQGATDLFVRDEAGDIRDWQPIEIRDPADALLFAYDAVAVGNRVPLEEVHVLPGSAATLAVAWATAEGNPLAGTGLLTVETADTDLAVAPTGALVGNAFEAFDLTVAEDADVHTASVGLLAADAVVREVPVVVHDPSEVTAVSLQALIDTDEEGGTGGTVRATVLATDTELVGVPVVWTDDGVEVGEGAWVTVEGEDTSDVHEIVGCLGDICDTMQVAGHITATFSAVAAEGSGSCGCAHGDAASWSASLVAGLLLVRKRRAAPASNGSTSGR